MALFICANCAVAMEQRKVGPVVFEQCPKCQGAWLEQDQYEALLRATGPGQSRRAPNDGGATHPLLAALPLEWRRPGLLVKAFAAAAALIVLVVGLAGYFVVWPLLSHSPGFATGVIAKAFPNAQKAFSERAKSLTLPTATEAFNKVDQAAKQAIDRAANSAKGMLNGTEQKAASKPNGTAQEASSEIEKPVKAD